MKKVVFLVVLIASCQTIEQSAEHALQTKLSTPIEIDSVSIIPIDLIQIFENQLIKNKVIDSVSKQSYIGIMESVIIDSLTINTEEFDKEYKIGYISQPSILTGILYSYIDIDKKYSNLNEDHSIKITANNIEDILERGDLGDIEANTKLVKEIKDKDFDKIIYRAAVIAIIYDIAERNYWNKKRGR